MLKDAKKDEDWCGALRRQGVNVDKALVRMKGNEAAYRDFLMETLILSLWKRRSRREMSGQLLIMHMD